MKGLKTYSRRDAQKPADKFWADIFCQKKACNVVDSLSRSSDSRLSTPTEVLDNSEVYEDITSSLFSDVDSRISSTATTKKGLNKKKNQDLTFQDKKSQHIAQMTLDDTSIISSHKLLIRKKIKGPFGTYGCIMSTSVNEQDSIHNISSFHTAVSSDSITKKTDVEDNSPCLAEVSSCNSHMQDIQNTSVPAAAQSSIPITDLSASKIAISTASTSRIQFSTPFASKFKKFSLPVSSIKCSINKKNLINKLSTSRSGPLRNLSPSLAASSACTPRQVTNISCNLSEQLFSQSSDTFDDSRKHSVSMNKDIPLRVIVYEPKRLSSKQRWSNTKSEHQISTLLEHFEVDKSQLTSREKVLKFCDQHDFILFPDVCNWKNVKNCKKIGEGSFGEVYSVHMNRKQRVFKIIPINNMELQNESFAMVLSEIIISKVLDDLRNSPYNKTGNFVKFEGAKCVKGSLPEVLYSARDAYASDCDSDKQLVYTDDQLFLILEYRHAGTPYELFQLKNPKESQSVYYQVACALGIAEESCMFEHRDLHTSNILLSRTRLKYAHYIHKGKKFSFPTCGIQVTLIDFSLSRLSDNQGLIFSDLKDDSSLFTGQGDYQFDIYRMTRNYNKNDWSKFIPYSNVLWLHYLLMQMRSFSYKKPSAKSQVKAKEFLLMAEKNILHYESAVTVMESLEVYNF